MARPWWRKHAMRIYHPEICEEELAELEGRRFIADCLAAAVEAVVVEAGGVRALYASQVPFHATSPFLGERDLLGEIVTEAHGRGLRVIAGIDFSRAGEEVWRAHPEWFERDPDGQVVRVGDHYVTCPSGGYRNADFAWPVIREILERYQVDGFHLHAPGFTTDCSCEACVAAFGAPLPIAPSADAETWGHYLAWRRQVVASELRGYYDLMRELNAECFLMAEMTDPQEPAATRLTGEHLPALSRACSRLLIRAGGLAWARRSRYGVGLGADLARATRLKRAPLVDVALHLGGLGSPQALLPPAEAALACYQALAHAAAPKVTTCGLPAHQADPRAMPTVGQLFSLIRTQQEVLDSLVPIHDAVLIWPGLALDCASPASAEAREGLQRECSGLYAALKARHVLFGVLYDEQITLKRLLKHEEVILPTAVQLGDEACGEIVSYVQRGGHLVLFDSPAASPTGRLLPLPKALAELIGGEWSEETRRADYMLPSGEFPLRYAPTPAPAPAPGRGVSLPRALSQVLGQSWVRGVRLAPEPAAPEAGAMPALGPLRLTEPYRAVRAPEGAQVWLRAGRARRADPSAGAGMIEESEDPLLFAVSVGEGVVVYAATGLGRMYDETGHGDYSRLLETMLSHGVTVSPYLLTDAPSAVEVTMCHWRLGVVVQLVNAAGPMPLDAPASVGPITLNLAWDGPARAQLCVGGAEPETLRCEEDWNRVRIVVPRLEAYAQVVVRSA